MTRCQNGGFTVGGNAVHQRLAFGGSLQFVANGADQQVFRRGKVVGLHTFISVVVHAVVGVQFRAAHPFLGNDAVVVRHGACHDGGDGRGTVNRCVLILHIRVHLPLLQQKFKASIAIERHEGIEIVRTQLVDRDTYNEPWHRGCLCHRACHCHRGNERCEYLLLHLLLIIVPFRFVS